MIEVPPGEQATNPFATSLVGLGQLDFLQEFEGQLLEIVQKTISARLTGQIVGPHGSGKTTLTIAIARQFADLSTCRDPNSNSEKHWRPDKFIWLVALPSRWPWRPVRFRVQLRAKLDASGQFQIESNSSHPTELSGKDFMISLGKTELVFVDGLELLSRWKRSPIVNCSGRHVIFTVHRRLAGPLPVLAELKPGIDLFDQLVRQLVGNFSQGQGTSLSPTPVCISESEIERAFCQAQGDIRKGLAFLYDLWEMKMRQNRRSA